MTTDTRVRFEDWEAEQMQDQEFRAAAEELEPAYQIARLRNIRGLTQEQLAELVGTHQSSIARLESGNTQPSLSFLRRVAQALGGQLTVQIVLKDDTALTIESTVVYTEGPNTHSKDNIIYVFDWPVADRLHRRDRWTDHSSAASH